VKDKFVEIGKIFTTFGLKGCVKVYPYSDSQTFESFKGKKIWIGNGQMPMSVKMSDVKRANKKSYLVELDGFNTIEKSKRIVGKIISVKEKELPPLGRDEYYFYQVIGMEAYDESNNLIGVVEDVIRTGANDVFVIKIETRDEEILIPSVKDYVLDIDFENSRMVVKMMEWY